MEEWRIVATGQMVSKLWIIKMRVECAQGRGDRGRNRYKWWVWGDGGSGKYGWGMSYGGG